MNDQMRAGGVQTAPPAIKQPCLAEIITSSLNEITDMATGVANDLGELERYMFGDKPNDKGSGSSVSSDQLVESWENDILRKLDNIKHIVNEQQQTLNAISKFHK